VLRYAIMARISGFILLHYTTFGEEPGRGQARPVPYTEEETRFV